VLAYNECNRASVGAIDTAVMYILTEDRYRSLEYRQTREILPEAAQVRPHNVALESWTFGYICRIGSVLQENKTKVLRRKASQVRRS